MTAHAILSPSSAHRWLECPPSAVLESKFPDRRSESAQEGTFAHKWAEVQLRHFLGQDPSETVFDKTISEMKNDDFYNPGLENYVDEYVDVVTNKFMEAQERDRGADLLLEQRLDFQKWVPNGFGHGDAVILADGTMEIIDLKYGRNVKVEAQNNPQLRLYALGAYQELCYLYDIDHVAMTIVQPRNGGESSETLSVNELLAWGDSIKPIAEIAIKGGGEFKAGEHCQFCRAAERCKKLAEYQMEIAKHDFKDPDLLSDEDIAEILSKVDGLVSWASSVKKFALKEAVQNNRKWPGWKLVEGKSCRTITDEEKAAGYLTKAGYADNQIWKPKELYGLTALEKLVGKKKLADLLEPVIAKPPGKPTLAPESDKRPEWNSASEDFEVINDDE